MEIETWPYLHRQPGVLLPLLPSRSLPGTACQVLHVPQPVLDSTSCSRSSFQNHFNFIRVCTEDDLQSPLCHICCPVWSCKRLSSSREMRRQLDAKGPWRGVSILSGSAPKMNPLRAGASWELSC